MTDFVMPLFLYRDMYENAVLTLEGFCVVFLAVARVI